MDTAVERCNQGAAVSHSVKPLGVDPVADVFLAEGSAMLLLAVILAGPDGIDRFAVVAVSVFFVVVGIAFPKLLVGGETAVEFQSDLAKHGVSLRFSAWANAIPEPR